MGSTCPITKQPLATSDIVSNSKLKWEISQWQLNYGDASKEMSKLEFETKLSKATMISQDYHISDILLALTGQVEEELKGRYDEEEEKKEGTAGGGGDETTKPAEPDVFDILDDVVDTVETT